MEHDTELPSAADFASVETRLFDRIAVKYRRQVIRHRLVAVAAVLVVAGAGVAAGTVANPSQQSNLAYCYGGTTTSSQVSQALLPNNGSFDSRSGTKPSAKRISNALALCEGAWKSGIFNKSSAAGPFPVPRLQVCLRDDLIVSVFRKPSASQSADAFCEALGQSAP